MISPDAATWWYPLRIMTKSQRKIAYLERKTKAMEWAREQVDLDAAELNLEMIAADLENQEANDLLEYTANWKPSLWRKFELGLKENVIGGNHPYDAWSEFHRTYPREAQWQNAARLEAVREERAARKNREQARLRGSL